MSTFTVDIEHLDYRLHLPGDKAPNSPFNENRKISETLLQNAAAFRFRSGTKDRGHKETWRGIAKKFLGAVLAEADAVELDVRELRWILETMQQWECPSALVPWELDFEEAIEHALEDARAAEKAAKAATKP